MKKPTIILQHGLGGPVAWFKTIQLRAIEAGCEVRIPLMDEPRTPHLSAWLMNMQKSYGDITDAIIVAHSLGCMALMHYMGQLSSSDLVPESETADNSTQGTARNIARAVILVAPPALFTGKPSTEDFYTKQPNWTEVKRHARQFIILQSRDDMWVPYAHAEIYRKHLDAELHLIDGEGHFLMNENELLWELIKKTL